MKILMVLTSHGQLGNAGRKIGFSLDELAAPFRLAKGRCQDHCNLVKRRSAAARPEE